MGDLLVVHVIAAGDMVGLLVVAAEDIVGRLSNVKFSTNKGRGTCPVFS